MNIYQKKCVLCHFTCLNCYGTNNFQCINCINGYILDSSTCVDTCPIGKYLDLFLHCDVCNVVCSICIGPT